MAVEEEVSGAGTTGCAGAAARDSAGADVVGGVAVSGGGYALQR